MEDKNSGEILVLDLDGTLGLSLIPQEIAFNNAFFLIKEELEKFCSIKLEQIRKSYSLAKRKLYRKYPFLPSRHDKNLRLEQTLAEIEKISNDVKIADGKLLEKVKKCYWDTFHKEAAAYPDTHRTMEELMDKLTVIIFTNNGLEEAELKRRIFELEEHKHFDVFVCSEELGVCKPGHGFYEKFSELLKQKYKINISENKVYMVGDDPEADIRIANEVGAISILIKKDLLANKEPSKEIEKPDYVIFEINEIIKIIDE